MFDQPDFLPFLPAVRRIAVTYATHDETGAPGTTNIVKPLYHVAWLASRLGLARAGAAGADEPKARRPPRRRDRDPARSRRSTAASRAG